MTTDAARIPAPSQPGVYLMKDSAGRTIYVGKAKNLKNRLRSYFGKQQDPKTRLLVAKIDNIEFIVTDSEEEAFVLESNLIKQYRPTYNIELKDQERYTYLRVTDEEYPRLLVARRTRKGGFVGGGRIYGPFTTGSAKLLAVGTLRKSFKIRICKTLPKKACLEYHLGNCEAPCEFREAQDKYPGHVRDLEDVLAGKRDTSEFTAQLKDEMISASGSLEFERAAEIRDTLARLESLRSEQKMERVRASSDEDYLGVIAGGGTATVMSLRQIHGVVRDGERFSFDLVADNTFSNFLYQYYTTRAIPSLVLVSEMPEEQVTLEKMLARRSGRGVRISVPARGRRRKMMDLIMRNIALMRSGGSAPGLEEVRDALGLDGPPRVIECFDVSNHADEYAVGAMSRFVDGMPAKSGYRRFKIKTVTGRDDYAMISEIVGRRYTRLRSEGSEMPDLVLIDGGRGHLAAAIASMQKVPVDLPCASIAKRDELVFIPERSGPVDLPRESPALSILRHARDEAHRFGVAYNKKLREIRR